MKEYKLAHKEVSLKVPIPEENPANRDVTTAQLMTGGTFPASAIVSSYGDTTTDLRAIMDTLQQQACAIHRGDLTQVESMLMNQAVALQGMFADLAVRAKKQESLEGIQCLSQLALRAQAGCRATLQTLAEVKSPRHVAFVKQTNIAQNQQVNSGVPSPAHARKFEVTPNEVLVEEQHGSKKMVKQAKKRASQSDTDLGAVDAVDGTAKPRGKAKRLP